MKLFKGHLATKTAAQLQREIDEVLAQPPTHVHHATVVARKMPSFKISTKEPAAMTAAEINKELDKLNEQDSTLSSLMIEAGRGYERPSEYLKMTDPLVMELRKNSDRRQALRIEISLRYGPNPPSRLPTGWGFGPRSRAHAQKKTTLLKDIEPGLRNVAQRSLDAENRFIAYAMKHGRLSRGQAETALAAFRKARVIKFDAVNGTFHVTHGQFLDRDVLRRAAGIEE
jgi:hypothetical protein